MAVTPSTMLPLGTPLPSFRLRDTVSGRMISSEELRDAPALLVAILCNHCPYVKHIRRGFVTFANEYRARGLAVVAVCANDAHSHPEDAPEEMAREARSLGFGFPYLHDETQETAKAFRAACTPEFYLFDAERKLVYRGQFDGSRPGNGLPVTGDDLRAAADAALEGRPVRPEQTPSVGCNVKWRPGNEPDYA
jgi:peroxiredoxin